MKRKESGERAIATAVSVIALAETYKKNKTLRQSRSSVAVTCVMSCKHCFDQHHFLQQQNRWSAKAKLIISTERRLCLASFLEQRHTKTTRLPRRSAVTRIHIIVCLARDVTPAMDFVSLFILTVTRIKTQISS